MASINPIKGLYDEFVKILTGTTIKYTNKANKTETLKTLQSADAYLAAMQGLDKFESYATFTESEIQSIGINDPYVISKWTDNPDNVPENFRDALFKVKHESILNNFTEMNDYYRVYLGLPPRSDTGYVFVSEEDAEELGIKVPSIPIHEMDDELVNLLWDLGYIDKLIAKYPAKTYLKYLGRERIDLLTARSAKNFALIKVPGSNVVNETILANFKLIYDQCREYFMSVIYVSEYTTIYDTYDNFIGLCIMVMTIQQLIARTMKLTIDRDFFDIHCINLLFEMYNIPTLPDVDFAEQKAIAQNLNLLIQNKATDKVLYDIATILGFTHIGIYKYLLVKQQRFNDDGTPFLPVGDDGLPDCRQQFDVYFQKLEVQDKDFYKALQIPRNRLTYAEVTLEDPFWIEDEELLSALYESVYNFTESKYLSVNISFKLSEIMFECIYFINMCLDKKSEVGRVSIDLPKIMGSDTVSVFDAVLAVCVLLCKKHHLVGEILHSESQVLHVLGFNFKADFRGIIEYLSDNTRNKYIPKSFINYLTTMNLYSPEAINTFYNNIRNLRDALTQGMAGATRIEEYRAYKRLFEALYITRAQNTIFNMGTDEEPKYAETYEEFLAYWNPDFYEALIDFIGDEGEARITTAISHILSKLNDVVEDLQHLYNLNDSTGGALNALIILIRFFKSYTTDMLGLNIVYLFNTKALNMLKLLDEIEYIHKENSIRENFDISHSDVISRIIMSLQQKDRVALRDAMVLYVSGGLSQNERFFLYDKILWTYLFPISERLRLEDKFGKISANHLSSSDLKLYDEMTKFTTSRPLSDRAAFRDELKFIS